MTEQTGTMSVDFVEVSQEDLTKKSLKEQLEADQEREVLRRAERVRFVCSRLSSFLGAEIVLVYRRGRCWLLEVHRARFRKFVTRCDSALRYLLS